LLLAAQIKKYKTSDFVIQEKEKGDSIYLIVQGEAEVFKSSDDAVHSLAKLGPLAWFGEIAWFNEEERTASVRALTPLTTLRFSFKTLKALKHGPSLIRTILAHIAIQRSIHLKGVNQQVLDAVRQELKVSK